jgi:phenylacetic acid degradation operon negative regulatory protein
VGETTVDDATGPEAGAISDGDLPTRMLVFGVARHDGTIPAADAFAVAAACCRSAEQVRSCLRRLVAEGLFTRDGVGQRALYRPTDDGLRALTAFGSRALRAHVQDNARDTWDGRWHLAAFAVPEARRTARDTLRDHLGLLGGAAVHNGLYVSPHPWDDDVTATATALGVVDHLTLAVTDRLTVGGLSEPRDLAARLWPLDDVAARYRAFLDRWSGILDGLGRMQQRSERLPDSAYLPGALAMGLAYRDCLDADPLLPPDLLPHPWPGREARDLLVRSRRLAQRIRADSDGPALFATYDDLVDSALPADPDPNDDPPPAPARPRPGGTP